MKQQAEAAFSGKIDAAKQKEALLTYVEYVTARNDEIHTSMEKAHEKERYVPVHVFDSSVAEVLIREH